MKSQPAKVVLGRDSWPQILETGHFFATKVEVLAEEDAFEAAVAALPRRGPDAQGSIVVMTFASKEIWNILLGSSY